VLAALTIEKRYSRQCGSVLLTKPYGDCNHHATDTLAHVNVNQIFAAMQQNGMAFASIFIWLSQKSVRRQLTYIKVECYGCA